MKIDKITYGFVVQTMDTKTGKCIAQKFKADDGSEYETVEGEPLEESEVEELTKNKTLNYHFDMVQPEK